jgi:hypothetical protein
MNSLSKGVPTAHDTQSEGTYDAGFQVGYDQGHKDGYFQGHEVATDDAGAKYDDGFENGYGSGYESGVGETKIEYAPFKDLIWDIRHYRALGDMDRVMKAIDKLVSIV